MTLKCEVCGDNVFAWTDFHGQVVCMSCGAPYQIKEFHGAPPDLKYPYIDLEEKFVPIFKEYWSTTKKRARLGMWLGVPPDVAEEKRALIAWLKENHPEWIEKK